MKKSFVCCLLAGLSLFFEKSDLFSPGLFADLSIFLNGGENRVQVCTASEAFPLTTKDSVPQKNIENSPTTTQAAPKLNVPMKTLGSSVENRPIEYALLGDGPDVLLIFAGIHGDEKAGVELVVRLGNYLLQNPSFLRGKTLILLPIANPDGYGLNQRENAHDVDLNRNFDTANRREKTKNGKIIHSGPSALSEPECLALKSLIETRRPRRIVSLHQIVKLKGYITRGLIDYNGPAEILACRMSENCPLMVKKWGARPGSFGSFAGEESNIPTITMELPKNAADKNADDLWNAFGRALLAAIVFPDKLPDKISPLSEGGD
jgi:protein MpaA